MATVLQSVVITTVPQPERVLAPDASLGWFVSGVQTLGLGPSGIVITVAWHPVDLGLAGLCFFFHVLAVPISKVVSQPHKEH